jgi:Cu/Ag efflux pump CusA
MAIGFGEGAEIWAPLGRVVVGGLCISTLFTLFFTPTLFTLIEALRPHPADLAPETAEWPAAVGD